MEINKQLCDFILWFWEIIEKLEREVVAQHVVFTLLDMSGLVPSSRSNELLEKARQNPSPLLAAQHKEARETLERLLNEKNPETALAKFLREWKPSGPIQ